jgi:hypothetical protein
MNRALAFLAPLVPIGGTSVARTVALVCVLAVGGVNAGCSFIFVDGVPPDHAKLEYFDCTSTYGLSVADGVIALSGGIAAGTALSQSKQAYADKNNGASRNAAAGVDIALTGVLAASALYGVVQATRCDRAKEELRARIFAAPLRPPPAPSFPPGPAPQAAPMLPAPGLSLPQPPVLESPPQVVAPPPVPAPPAPTP